MASFPSKKIITICHYGGWFETNEDGSMSYSGGEAYAVDLDDNMRLVDFMQEIAETLDSSVEGVLVKCFLPRDKKNLITVSKDEDFNQMVSYYKESDQMEVFIMKESPPAKTKQSAHRPRKRPAETQVVTVLPPAEQGAPNTLPPNKVSNPIPINPFPMSTTNNGPQPAAKPWENVITGVGQRFHSLNEFREALRKYSLALGFNYVYKKNENQRVTVKCKSEGCPWQIHASKLASTQLLCIKTMTPTHSCQGGGSIKTAFQATRSLVGGLIIEKVKDSPMIKPQDIAYDVKRDFGFLVSYSQARRAKEYAREQLLGSYKDVCSELPFYCEKIMEVNPGSVARFCMNEVLSFRRLFVAFNASVSGFIQGCLPLLFLDRTPLNSRYQGMLLTATSADGDGGVFPVAFAVVDEENDDNWRWFLTELKSMVLGHDPITFVADSQKGLRESLPEIFGGECYHAYCLDHLAEKLNKDLAGHFSHDARQLIIEDLYAAAYAPKLDGFEKYTEHIKEISPEAYSWIVDSEPDHWANACFGGLRYNHMSSSFGNGFYSWVSEANELPITKLIDELRGKMMQMIYTRRGESSQWLTRLTPSMEEKLMEEILKARSVQVLQAHGSKFEVQFDGTIDIVDIENWDCTCKVRWLTGLPCCHAIAVLEVYGWSPYDYCAKYFHVEKYHLVYADSINPIPDLERLTGVELGDGTVLVTQPTTRTPGRTKMRKVASGRVAPADFLKRPLQCGNCSGLGHNRRSCKEVL